MARILSIDFGLKRSGIAITDDMQMIASPLTTVHSNELETFLKKYVSDNKVAEIVIGYPVDVLGKPTNITQNVELLKSHLEKVFPAVHIALHDERFTSSMASASLIESGMTKKKRQQKGNLDMTSAAIILQGYLRYKESRS